MGPDSSWLLVSVLHAENRAPFFPYQLEVGEMSQRIRSCSLRPQPHGTVSPAVLLWGEPARATREAGGRGGSPSQSSRPPRLSKWKPEALRAVGHDCTFSPVQALLSQGKGHVAPSAIVQGT